MNTKGERERALKKQLEKFYNNIWSADLSLSIINSFVFFCLVKEDIKIALDYIMV